MSTYTIKLGVENDLIIENASGERVMATQLLDECGESRVVALDAPMGTGKTTLIKKIVEEMGSEDVVNSPTFAIVNVYEADPTRHLSNGGEKMQGREIYHFDCYRLKDVREALDFGAEEYFYSGNWCFVEWPDVIESILPEDTVVWKIRTKENGDRELTIA